MLRGDGELHVAAALQPQSAHDLQGAAPQRLDERIGEGLDGRDHDRIARVDAHRIHVLHATDGDGGVRRIAEHLELDLLPAEQAALHQHLTDGADLEAVRDPLPSFREAEGEPATPTAEREGRADHDGLTKPLEEGHALLDRLDDRRLRHRLANACDQVAEAAAILRGTDRRQRRAQDADAIPIQDAGVIERDRQVQAGLPSKRRQQAVRSMARDDPLEVLDGQRTDDHRPGDVRIGHHRRGIRVDQDRLDALRPQRQAGLHARIVELRGLPDDDRPGADHQDATGRRHAPVTWNAGRPPASAWVVARSKMRAASMGPGAPSGWNWTDAMRPEA